MNQTFKQLLLGTALCCGTLVAQAQGLEGIIVEEYHTVTQADADFLNNDLGNSSFTIAPGSKVYRVYVDMLPGYKLNQVFGAPETFPGSGVSLNPLDFSTTTTFWNDDNFGSELPAQTRRIDEGTAFDSYITVNTTGTAGGTAGCGVATQQFGVLRTADTDGDLTTCGVYPGFTGNDGSIPGTGPALTYNISGLIDFAALTGSASSLQVINDAWTTLPASQGVDPSGTNRVLIGQFTTDGTFSFHINVQLSDPNSNLETYVWNQAGAGEVVSPLLTYPQALPPDCNGVPGGPAVPGTACDDGLATTGNDTWDANCVCVGQLIDCEGTPGGSALPGTACDDGLATTGNDTYDANCTCVGQLIDCEGTPGGSALPGTACDDGLATTGNDTWDANCTCVGLLIDCEGTPGGSALPGTACDDGLATTGNDTWDANCTCVGLLIDCEGTPGGSALPGTACDDGNPNSSNDTWDANCTCSGTLANDCLGVPGGPAQPGTPCDDGLATTGNDLWDANCVCVGQLIDCEGTPGGSALPGTACDDGLATTGNDTWDANCTCVGQLIDCLGVPGGSALPGTACDDGNPNSSNDTYDANCNCVGQLANDCLGAPGGPAQPGTPCDDGLATTGNDLWDANCVCVGQLIDCEGTPGGSALPGTACDDGNPNSSNDTWDANCTCVGQLANDCLGVPGGSALPGTPCDDGQAQTGNDTWDANCNCIGEVIDCLGVPGGSALPGSACDDGNAATINDVYDANCTCAGTPLGNCTEILTLDITLDNNGAETTWEVRDETGTTVILSGGPYQNGQAGSIVTETLCLNQICYRLIVNDAGGDGINGGGYVLTDANGRRIVDANGSFTSTSSVINEFCLPLSVARLINASCDRTNLTYSTSTQIYASFYPGASGYQFWIFDPHGSYSRRVFKTTQNLVPANLVTLPVPADLDLNVRVRALVGGNYTAFGPACRFRLNTPGGAGREAVLFDEASNVTMSLYPNPNRGEVVNVAFDGIAAAERMDIDVMDIFGKRVMAEQIAAPGGAFVHTMDMAYLAPGVYMVNVRVGERLYTQRLVRQ
ncbi:MAG: T9SS type A sorting domain-containing protein [Flavobacteriales bacterium]|nr:T9SS type A sorting domain-containing protein [Flavobacteriales bacterium]